MKAECRAIRRNYVNILNEGSNNHVLPPALMKMMDRHTDLYSKIDMLSRVKVHAVKKWPTGSPMEVVQNYITVLLRDTETAKANVKSTLCWVYEDAASDIWY